MGERLLESLQDKKAILNVIAGLMANPEIMGNEKEYNTKVDDMPEKFHKIIFGAMYNLFQQGITEIQPQTIDAYLGSFPAQYKIYEDNNGLDYLFKVKEFGMPSNFDYYYQRMKKYSFLRECVARGINTDDILDPKIVDIKEAELQRQFFDSMNLEDMFKHVEGKLIDIKDNFLFESSGSGSHMAHNLRQLVADKMSKPSYGAGLNSGLYTAATRGARLKKVYLVSAPSGVGKSRFSLSSMLSICVPEIWNSDTKQWEKTGATGKCLFITTELEEDEVKIPALCYIADINEDKLQNADLTEEEKVRIEKAIDILEVTPFWFEELHDFDLEDIEHVIVKNINKHGIQYVS